ncbi:MAG TPA: hypothetical protein VMS35_04915 [Nitrososphaeraceae archaeon]|jgi:hypothetical protein|nr:hypothetical protein [Nitrososphaeraceae archaeon]HSF50471.1 hypothetical protein [Nitrososphaeraceae archaeon]HVP82362.1 hypothetical protein [Nitrososphaeraceae archaeon]
MKGNKTTGIFLLTVPSLLFFLYVYLLFSSHLDLLIIKLTITATVGVVITVFVWIGYTMVSSTQNTELPDN